MKLILCDLFPPSNSKATTTSSNQVSHDEDVEQFLTLELIPRFREQIRNKKIPFSMNFELKHVIGTGVLGRNTHELNHPKDVVVSYNHSCILIADFNNHRVLVHDLMTYRFKKSIPLSFPAKMCIESNYKGGLNDALIIAQFHHEYFVCKYDLSMLLNNQRTQSNYDLKYLWKSETYFYNPEKSMTISRAKKQVFIADNKDQKRSRCYCVKILCLETGERVQTIYLHGSPYGMTFIEDYGFLVVGTHLNNKIQMFKYDGIDSWNKINSFGKSGKDEGELCYPSSLIYEQASQHIIECNYSNARIQVFKLDGSFVKSFGSRELSIEGRHFDLIQSFLPNQRWLINYYRYQQH
ncbi:hypothetical protein C9374_009254 [Naegleria lovaniensis]|uniref:Uncharacterized protein n=1 Tax=Naegleria lovaniensis TaxID=51637 RepID=A0AA88GF56_NAELO|nr:uncharacterized protein C9374_009254 [Naegleria lovaniensis]KAG2377343.1 hypothetical protein C9374_009254 [Naegleria lovaniensis]